MLLNYVEHGHGDIVVMLHGMAGSLKYWQECMPALAINHRVIAVDLLGFGGSPQAPRVHDIESHCSAIKDTLDYIGITDGVTLVGHSMGALLALKFATIYPALPDKLILISMPVYKTPSEAKAGITRGKRILEYVYYGYTSRIICSTWCRLLRPVSKRVAPYYLRSKPKPVAMDSVLHTWNSYSESFHYVIENQSVEAGLNSLAMPIELIYGTQESPIVLENVKAMKLNDNVRLAVVDGTHNLPLEKSDLIADYINKTHLNGYR